MTLHSNAIDRMANLAEAADAMEITVSVLKKLNKNHEGPEFCTYKGEPFYAWDELARFITTRTISRTARSSPR